MEEKKNLIPKSKLEARMVGEPTTEWEGLNAILEALNAKRDEAVIRWTIRKMGLDYYRRYVFPAEKRFLMYALLYTIKNNCDIITAIHQVPYVIPTRANKKSFPFDPHEMLEEYRECLDRIGRIKRRNWNSRSQRLLAIKHAFPGITEEMLKNYDSMPKASHVALDVIKWKYKLPIGLEAIKKYLLAAKKDKKMVRDIEKLARQGEKEISHLEEQIKSLK